MRKNMTEEANADDFQVQNFLKKKKRKNHKQYKESHENDERLSCASPVLFEEQAAQSDEGCKKKKKTKKKRAEQQYSLDNSSVGLEHEIRNETGEYASQKRKRKQKYSDSTDEQSDVTYVTVNHHSTDCQELNADYVYLKKSVKKKRKEKLPEEDEACELPPPEMHDNNDNKRSKKKRKKRRSSTQDIQEDTDVILDQSLLSSPEQNRPGEDTVRPLPTAERGVATPQQRHEHGDCGAAPARRKDSMKVPANSKLSKAADKSQKRPVPGGKIKSCVFVMEESSSESDVPTSEPLTSNRKEDKNSSFTKIAASDELTLDDEECLDYSTCSVVDLDTAKQELEEFIPHVRNISDSSIKKMAGRDLTRFKEFKKQGIAVKFGRFSQKENNQIRKNVEEFLLMTGIDSAEKVLFTSRYPEDKETINRLKAEHLFCEKLSEGIPRPWRLIYYRARKMFDPNNYKGRYTKEEKEKLKKYHAMHGNDWKKISEMMSRSNLSVAMKYSEIKSAINYGPWSKEETQKLMHAVEEVIRKRTEMEDANSLLSSSKSKRDLSIDREKLYQKLPWTEIEAKVGTRYWRQCKQKWTTILTNKMTKGQQLYRGTKGLQAKINLIKRLYEMKVEDANDINWEELSNTIGDVPRAYVQAKFYKLKVSCVPFWQKKSFSEIIDYLFKKKLPELEENLEKRKGKQLSSDNSTASQQKAAFQLSDIFDCSEESD
ncbi:transcription termination factor 1 [Athene cunicularia]|uniref:Transcription termination factor 1 n=1 Tax=Athene cunicularia TaxID=194338 RepID=A0A663N371_ATHCN|nr:transcription termination factor 1 [Athene cunicularia]XP_026716533.1 transcription termination factor 1 [Athene cunicularia]XP_026716534.1 transcription termination factor 1 [Athene cunicularia]